VAYGPEGCDVHAVADQMTAGRRSVGRVRRPPGIHLMLMPVHAPIVDDHLADLAASVATMRAGAGTGRAGLPNDPRRGAIVRP